MASIEQVDKVYKIEQELREYIELEGAELSEACYSLIRLSHYPDYISDEFYSALLKELEDQLSNFKENSRIVETEETITVKSKELEWNF